MLLWETSLAASSPRPSTLTVARCPLYAPQSLCLYKRDHDSAHPSDLWSIKGPVQVSLRMEHCHCYWRVGLNDNPLLMPRAICIPEIAAEPGKRFWVPAFYSSHSLARLSFSYKYSLRWVFNLELQTFQTFCFTWKMNIYQPICLSSFFFWLVFF